MSSRPVVTVSLYCKPYGESKMQNLPLRAFYSNQRWEEVVKHHKLTKFLDPTMFHLVTRKDRHEVKFGDKIEKILEHYQNKSRVSMRLAVIAEDSDSVPDEEQDVWMNTVFDNLVDRKPCATTSNGGSPFKAKYENGPPAFHHTNNITFMDNPTQLPRSSGMDTVPEWVKVVPPMQSQPWIHDHGFDIQMGRSIKQAALERLKFREAKEHWQLQKRARINMTESRTTVDRLVDEMFR